MRVVLDDAVEDKDPEPGRSISGSPVVEPGHRLRSALILLLRPNNRPLPATMRVTVAMVAAGIFSDCTSPST